MIKYEKSILKNGLTVICNEDKSTPFVSVNILYKVGSRNEEENKTGYAHLFEHLMFSGSKNIVDYDKYVQKAGGESNAYTTNDYTNYYITLPASNIETALWLESDRMAALSISQKSLDIQKQVVIEEFKQRYLNKPYGDIWLNLRPLAYRVHPYRWATIGRSTDEIADAKLEDITKFYKKFYSPSNAIISISGNINTSKAHSLVAKWFEDIPNANLEIQEIPSEPKQIKEHRIIIDNNDVPADAIYKVFHMGKRNSENFYAADIISDILSNGQSARLYINLIKEQRLFSGIDAYITGDFDPGLFIFSGKLSDGIGIEKAEDAILEEIDKFLNSNISSREIQKVINKAEARIAYGEINYQNKSSVLAFFEFLGDLELVNTEVERYQSINIDKIKQHASEIFTKTNSSTLLYLK